MDEEWDADNFQHPDISVKAAGDKWAGEDEEDDVKDNWEDEEEEEKKDEEKQEEIKAFQVKKKKTLAEKIEEKERQEKEELARKQAAREAMRNLTPQEKQAEKLRQQKLQEEADLQVTRETFGLVEADSTLSLDNFNPSTEEDFNNLVEMLYKKLQICSSSTHFPLFVENLLRKVCASMNSVDVKKLKTTIDTVYLEKNKLEKAQEKSKKQKGKGKARLMVEGDNEYSAYGAAEYDDFEDFM